MIAALFVAAGGCYVGLPDVDPWPAERDARSYDGPHPVVAHPPCERWGAMALGGSRRDGGRAFGLSRPQPGGGWTLADERGGWTCCVEQGHYGHRARKATWLYASGVELPELVWGASAHAAPPLPTWVRHPPKGATAKQQAARRAYLARHAEQTGKVWCCPEMLSKSERRATPPAFRDLLLSIARSALAARGAA